MASLRSILGFINWPSFFLAGFLAGVAKVAVYQLTGNEPFENSPTLLQSVFVLVFSSMVFYALIYVLFIHNATGFASNKILDRIIKAIWTGLGQVFISILVMPWFFKAQYSGPNPKAPEPPEGTLEAVAMVNWDLLPWDYSVFWEFCLIYLTYALVIVFVYKSPAEKRAKQGGG